MPDGQTDHLGDLQGVPRNLPWYQLTAPRLGLEFEPLGSKTSLVDTFSPFPSSTAHTLYSSVRGLGSDSVHRPFRNASGREGRAWGAPGPGAPGGWRWAERGGRWHVVCLQHSGRRRLTGTRGRELERDLAKVAGPEAKGPCLRVSLLFHVHLPAVSKWSPLVLGRSFRNICFVRCC